MQERMALEIPWEANINVSENVKLVLCFIMCSFETENHSNSQAKKEQI